MASSVATMAWCPKIENPRWRFRGRRTDSVRGDRQSLESLPSLGENAPGRHLSLLLKRLPAQLAGPHIDS
jgi:hypothetical protein